VPDKATALPSAAGEAFVLLNDAAALAAVVALDKAEVLKRRRGY